MLDRANSDPTFMKRIITGDVIWVYTIYIQNGGQNKSRNRKNHVKVAQNSR